MPDERCDGSGKDLCTGRMCVWQMIGAPLWKRACPVEQETQCLAPAAPVLAGHARPHSVTGKSVI